MLAHALGQRRGYAEHVSRLRGILKTNVSYSGQYCGLEEGRRIVRKATAFSTRAEDMPARRP